MAEKENVKIVETLRPPKVKPQIDEETKTLMAKRKSKPKFIRQQFWQFGRLADTWRRPRGRTSKQRRHVKYRPPIVRIGYGSPKKIRGLQPSGFAEKSIYTIKELEKIDVTHVAIRIGGTVGKKKRIAIIEKADEMGIRVLNRGI